MSLITCQQALDLIRSKMRDLPSISTETVSLQQSLGRVLAADVTADRDQPPFRRSTRDGYAVRASDGGARTLIGSVPAGRVWTGGSMAEGQAIEIMTGAPVPEGADAVIMLEHITLQGNDLQLQRDIAAGENIVPRGAEAKFGDQLLTSGTRITAAEIALLASVGVSQVTVFAQPTAAILATGDELVAIHETPQPHQIRNSNSHALAALVQTNGGIARILPPAQDTRESLGERFAAARNAQVLLITGGVSAGKYDLVEDVLLEQGAEFFFTGVRIQPGKPAVFGRIPANGTHPQQWIFGLPGNPVSTQVTALLFAMPMLRALGGETDPAPLLAQATLATDVTVKPGLTRFLPARLTSALHTATVAPTGWQGSGDLNSNARANCYLVVPPDAETLTAGAVANVLLR